MFISHFIGHRCCCQPISWARMTNAHLEDLCEVLARLRTSSTYHQIIVMFTYTPGGDSVASKLSLLLVCVGSPLFAACPQKGISASHIGSEHAGNMQSKRQKERGNASEDGMSLRRRRLSATGKSKHIDYWNN